MPHKKDYIYLSIILLLVIMLVFSLQGDDDASPPLDDDPELAEPGDASPEVTRTTRLIRPGTEMETPLYIITAPEDGPTVMVMGGVHGDEIAGHMAAGIISGWSIDRGTLLVLPRANAQAVNANTRYSEYQGNLNASFPGNALGNPTERLAAEIYEVLKELKPLWVVDLHEAHEFERVQSGQLGQTIIYHEEAPSVEVVEQIAEGLNRLVTEELHRYQVLRGGVPGGTIQASFSLGLESFTIETTRKLPLEQRIEQHLEAVRLLLSILGVNVFENT